ATWKTAWRKWPANSRHPVNARSRQRWSSGGFAGTAGAHEAAPEGCADGLLLAVGDIGKRLVDQVFTDGFAPLFEYRIGGRHERVVLGGAEGGDGDTVPFDFTQQRGVFRGDALAGNGNYLLAGFDGGF